MRQQCLREKPILQEEMETARWERLEQYARWKRRTGNLLVKLPLDMLHHMCSFLPRLDFLRLVEALLSVEANLYRAKDVPSIFINRWFRETSQHALEWHVRSMSDQALFLCRDMGKCVLMANWSPFCKSIETPLAEYRWSLPLPIHASIVINHERIRDLIEDRIAHSSCAIRLTLHMVQGIFGKMRLSSAGYGTHVYCIYPSQSVSGLYWNSISLPMASACT